MSMIGVKLTKDNPIMSYLMFVDDFLTFVEQLCSNSQCKTYFGSLL